MPDPTLSPEAFLGLIDIEDRSAAIVAAAMLEEALRRQIEAFILPPTNRERDILSRTDAPLGTFSAKIDAAYQLGLISRHLHRDLHLVRRIRNDAAHSHGEFSFDLPPWCDRITALQRASDYNNRHPDTRRIYGPPGPRGDFLGLTGWILYSLDVEVDGVVRLDEKGPEFGYIDWDSLPAEVKRILDDRGSNHREAEPGDA